MTPQVVIELAGGLGNQMFQYAFFLKMQSLGYPCKFYFDKSQYIHNGPELNGVFGLPLSFATSKEIDYLLDRKMDFASRLKRKVLGARIARYWEHDKGYDFKPQIMQQRQPVYLQGCWLSPLYFLDIEGEVRNAFRFPEINDAENQEVLMRISSSPFSVAIHARFGDYFSSTTHANLDYRDYLGKAISRLPGTNARDFFIFSDDLQEIIAVMNSMGTHHGSFHFVSGNDGNKSWKDMALMSKCHHQIIANSSFSWWAAWLNADPDKIVISPKEWFTTDFLNRNDIVPEEWITI